MYLRLRPLILVFTFFALAANAQTGKNSGILKGTLLKSKSQQPAQDLQLAIPKLKLITTSDAEGKFSFSDVKYGSYQMVISGYYIKNDTVEVSIDKEINDLGNVGITPNEAGAQNLNAEIPTITMDEGSISTDDDGVSSQNVSSVLTSSRDPFISATSYVFSAFWFRARGYDNGQNEIQINGVPMNDAGTGEASWNEWGGLNDVLRGRSFTYGLRPSEYTFGRLGGSQYIDATALNQRKQTKISYASSNRNYRNRLMVTHSSGLMKNGWAYSISASKRWAKEGYVPGTFYDGYSYFGAVSKVYKKHEFNLTAFGAPTRRGKASPAVQEADDLAGSNFYNPNWGYQNGEKRNAKIANNNQPVFIFNYQYKPSDKTRWNTSIGYQFGKDKTSSLDWNNAADPRPDYYRYLPSYYTIGDKANQAAADELKAEILANPDKLQIDWDRMYENNRHNTETIHNVNGVAGNDVTGNRSLYVLSDYVSDEKKWVFNTNIEHSLDAHTTLFGGINYIAQSTENYRQLVDLLGGDFFVNVNQFTARNLGTGIYSQNDLNNPNALVKEGDKYGYDYINHYGKGQVWGQVTAQYNKIDLFLAANAGLTSYYREGLYKNGLFPESSYGNGEKHSFFTGHVKGGITYKLNGRNYFFVNGDFGSDAPDMKSIYIAPNIRDGAVPNATTEKIKSIEGGYLMKAPRVNARIVGYATDITDVTKYYHFYNADPNFQSFTDFIVQGLNTRYIGLELALNVKLTSSLDVTGVAILSQAFFTNNPTATVYNENDTASGAADNHTVYLNNYSMYVGPQSAYTLGFHYSSKYHWYGTLNFNYADRNYVDINPDRRSDRAADLIPKDSELWHKIFDQEKMPSVFTTDLFVGYSFKLSHISKKLGNSSYIYLSVGVNNLLNNKNISNLGYEQLRYDFSQNEPGKFATKYFYGYGRNYFANIAFKF